jgi:hypothetical protein
MTASVLTDELKGAVIQAANVKVERSCRNALPNATQLAGDQA